MSMPRPVPSLSVEIAICGFHPKTAKPAVAVCCSKAPFKRQVIVRIGHRKANNKPFQVLKTIEKATLERLKYFPSFVKRRKTALERFLTFPRFTGNLESLGKTSG